MKTVSFYRVNIRHRRFPGIDETIDVVAGTVGTASKKAMKFFRQANPEILNARELPGLYVDTISSQGKIVL